MADVVRFSSGSPQEVPSRDQPVVVKEVAGKVLRVTYGARVGNVSAATMASLVPEQLRYDDRACVFTDYLDREDLTRHQAAVARGRVATLERSGVLRPGLKVEVDGRTYEVPRFILDVDPLQGHYLTINSAQVVLYDRAKNDRLALSWASQLGRLLIDLALASMEKSGSVPAGRIGKDDKRRLRYLLPDGVKLVIGSRIGRLHINCRLSTAIVVAGPLRALVRHR
jgi:hypothetical protein